MEYIRLYLGFFQSRKTKKLKIKCGDSGIVCLQKLWIYATQNKQDGILVNMTSEDIEIEVDWLGDCGDLIGGLIFSGYLIKKGDVYELSEWLSNNSHLDPEAIEKRKARAAKGGFAKAKAAACKHNNPTAKQEKSAYTLLNPANLTKPNLKEPNLTKQIIEMFNEISGQRLHVDTPQYVKAVSDRITGLGKRGIKEEADILKAFRYVFENKKLHANDEGYFMFKQPMYNFRTLTRKDNFTAYLDEPLHKKAKEDLTRGQRADILNKRKEAVR